jgi:hydrogenase nickel incorporation protein HypA/HybF
MHELSVSENVLNIAQKHAIEANASRVTDIYITVGRLSSIVDDSIQFYWDIISQDTICKGAQLHFNRIPARLLCMNCSNEFTLDAELSPCPSCGSVQLKVVSGEEFFLDSIAIEKEGIEEK